MLVSLLSADPRPTGGSPLLNLAILVVVVAVAWPLLARLRRSTSQKRRQRWQEEDRARGVPADDADRDGHAPGDATGPVTDRPSGQPDEGPRP